MIQVVISASHSELGCRNHSTICVQIVEKKELLTYLNSSKIENVTNNDVAQLHNYVSNLKQSAEVQGKFMTMGEWMDAYTANAVAAAFSEGEQTGFSKGEVSGRINALLDILTDYGTVPDDFQARLQNIDEDTLKHWTKLASKATSMEEFLEQI